LGHKVHPTGFRLGVVKGWQSSWFAERDYKDIWAEDFMIRQIVNKELANASVSKIEIERTAADQVLVKVFTARPGIVIGKSGEKVDRLRNLLESKTKKRRVRMDIVEIRQPELDAVLVGRSIAEQLEKRVSFRRAMKQAVQKSMRANAKGIKVIVAGRLGGAEIARTEKEVEGKVPLQTLRADIDYGQTEAHTTFGVIGIKVWIYRGDILPHKRREAGDIQAEASAQPTFAPREERGERRGGERRPRGDRQQGERGPRQPRQQQGGERGPRQPRQAQAGAEARGERGPRPPRQAGGQQSGGQQQGGERGPRPPRPPRQSGGEGGQSRPPRSPRQQGSATGQSQVPVSSENAATPAVPALGVEATPSVPSTPPTPSSPPTSPPPSTPPTDDGTTGTTQQSE